MEHQSIQQLTLKNKTKVVYGRRWVGLRVELTMLSFSLASDVMTVVRTFKTNEHYFDVVKFKDP